MPGACSAPSTLPSSISLMPLNQLSHQLIHDMLTHIQLPPPVEQNLGDVYFKLQVFVSTPDWNTDALCLCLSGRHHLTHHFPLCFDPLVKLANQHPLEGTQGTICQASLCKILQFSHIIQQIRSAIHPQLHPGTNTTLDLVLKPTN